MEVISRHLDIDPDGVEVAVERRGHNDELVANIPVRRNYGRTRDGAPIPLDRPKPPPISEAAPLADGWRAVGGATTTVARGQRAEGRRQKTSASRHCAS